MTELSHVIVGLSKQPNLENSPYTVQRMSGQCNCIIPSLHHLLT